MNPNMLCSKCKKRMAVVFVTRMEGDKPINEGLCIKCAKEMNIKPVTDLLDNGKMETTFYRAKEVQPVVEKMITLGKKGDLAAYRKALAFITKEDVAHKLFKEIAPKYADRNGGYTRVTRTGERRGDAAEMAVIELV